MILGQKGIKEIVERWCNQAMWKFSNAGGFLHDM